MQVMQLLKRLPAFPDILPVFAVITTMFYGWTMVIFLWKLPGWLFFLTAGEIAGIFAYQMTINLIESLVVLLLLLLFSMALPAHALKDIFVIRGSAAALILIGSMMLFLNRYVSVGPEFRNNLYWWMLGTLLVAIVLTTLSTRVRFLSASISWISDQLIVFLLVLMPLSAISIIYVVVHSLF
jgi:hypothetical protein